MSLQDQLGTVVVLNILHNLEKSHSTYAHAFIHVHRDVGKAIVDTELCLLYLNSLKPWMKQLADSYSTEALTHIFPPLMHLLFLTWQYSRLVILYMYISLHTAMPCACTDMSLPLSCPLHVHLCPCHFHVHVT